MAISKASVTLYYDVVSPWAYFSYTLLKRYQKAWNIDLILKPVYLGGVMVASGNKPPITVKNKGVWMNSQDMPLVSKYLQIPVQFPDSFPVNTINIMRLLRVIEDEAPAKLGALSDIFYGQTWGPETKGATASAKVENFRGIIPPSLLSDDELKRYVELSQSAENKERIKSDAAKLVEEGAFGFPWMVVKNGKGETHKFFGNDRFEVMAFFLGEGRQWNGPYPAAESKL